MKKECNRIILARLLTIVGPCSTGKTLHKRTYEEVVEDVITDPEFHEVWLFLSEIFRVL